MNGSWWYWEKLNDSFDMENINCLWWQKVPGIYVTMFYNISGGKVGFWDSLFKYNNIQCIYKMQNTD